MKMKNQKLVEFVTAFALKHQLELLNPRKLDDFKSMIFRGKAGKQFAIYDRTGIILRLQDSGYEKYDGVISKPCAKGDSFNKAGSNFKDGAGFCYEIQTIESLSNILNDYYELR